MKVALLGMQEDGAVECSTVAISMAVIRDGSQSWKIHFMNMVDEFRRTLDTRLIIMPPVKALPRKRTALLASIVCALSDEAGIDTPQWARQSHFLSSPWFVSGSEALKASAILESPLVFRRNNIFVLENFLERI